MEADEMESDDKLWSLIKDVKIAMLTTQDEHGDLHSRPMATQQKLLDGDLWFFTRDSSAKSGETKKHPQVNLSYANPDDNRYVSVTGSADIVHDKKRARKLWNPVYKAWFPQGLDDPDMVLLRVRVERAEYWDSPSSTMVQVAGFVKAMVSGKSYEPGPGEHGKL